MLPLSRAYANNAISEMSVLPSRWHLIPCTAEFAVVLKRNGKHFVGFLKSCFQFRKVFIFITLIENYFLMKNKLQLQKPFCIYLVFAFKLFFKNIYN